MKKLFFTLLLAVLILGVVLTTLFINFTIIGNLIMLGVALILIFLEILLLININKEIGNN